MRTYQMPNDSLRGVYGRDSVMTFSYVMRRSCKFYRHEDEKPLHVVIVPILRPCCFELGAGVC